MSESGARDGALLGGVALLERAVSYALGSLHLVTRDALAHATPCPWWDLGALLWHLDDAVVSMLEAVTGAEVALGDSWGVQPPAGDPVGAVRSHARELIGACSRAEQSRCAVAIAGLTVSTALVATTGAVEIAVHGWDAAQACGRHRPLPASLAADLLEVVPLFVTDADRPGRFAPPVELPRRASPADRLVAYLGRNPHRALVNRAGSWLCAPLTLSHTR
ncbi:MAG: TIGR03086 family protein [Streptosporangiales bacterium]|nr:TIGR03086 family protein [Streptosporangiales bacterium]MBO0890390.1 TIGR03086 family protein [Acidothermales bacterium]